MRYEELRHYNVDEINEILERGNMEEVKLLPLSLGEYHSDPNFVQKFCISLLNNYQDYEVRANAILGLSYLARRFRKLDRSIKPYLEREKKNNIDFNERVKYSIEDINIFIKWK